MHVFFNRLTYSNVVFNHKGISSIKVRDIHNKNKLFHINQTFFFFIKIKEIINSKLISN